MTKKYFQVTSKTTCIDVVLHAELDFDIIFVRGGDSQIHHLKITLFTKGFLEESALKVVLGEAFGFASLLVIISGRTKNDATFIFWLEQMTLNK